MVRWPDRSGLHYEGMVEMWKVNVRRDGKIVDSGIRYSRLSDAKEVAEAIDGGFVVPLYQADGHEFK